MLSTIMTFLAALLGGGFGGIALKGYLDRHKTTAEAGKIETDGEVALISQLEKMLINFGGRIDILDDQVIKLQETNGELRMTNAALKFENAALAEVNHRLNEKVGLLTSRVTELESHIQKLEARTAGD